MPLSPRQTVGADVHPWPGPPMALLDEQGTTYVHHSLPNAFSGKRNRARGRGISVVTETT